MQRIKNSIFTEEIVWGETIAGSKGVKNSVIGHVPLSSYIQSRVDLNIAGFRKVNIIHTFV